MTRLFVICGLIGSGKTTYSRKHFNHYTDYDELPYYQNKQDQIYLTLNLLKHKKEVAHITTYPTQEELNQLGVYNPKYIWINTSLNQCKTNILIRNRESDMNNLHKTFKSNEKILLEFKHSDLDFEVIEVFNKRGNQL